MKEDLYERWALSLLSSLALVYGLMVIRAQNPVHAVLFFILVFCETSGLLLLLELDFFAMIFLVIYIGAIAVFFLFVVMIFNIKIAEIHEEVLRYLPVSALIGLRLWTEILFRQGQQDEAHRIQTLCRERQELKKTIPG